MESSEEEYQQWELNKLTNALIPHNQINNNLNQISKKEIFHEITDITTYLTKKQNLNTQHLSQLSIQLESTEKELHQYQSQLTHLQKEEKHRQELFQQYQSLCDELDSQQSTLSFERKKMILNQLHQIETELLL